MTTKQTIDTKQLNVTLSADSVNQLKRFCYLNGITIAGLMRNLIPRVMNENIDLNLTDIRRADFEQRSNSGSRF